jgi:hypothetical protein
MKFFKSFTVRIGGPHITQFAANADAGEL